MEFDTDAATQRINTYWTGSRACPICESQDWVVMNKIWQLLEFRGGGINLAGPTQPLISVMCNVCGYTLMFNAIAVGAVKQPSPQGG